MALDDGTVPIGASDGRGGGPGELPGTCGGVVSILVEIEPLLLMKQGAVLGENGSETKICRIRIAIASSHPYKRNRNTDRTNPVYERYPISGIKQSYRYTSRTRTIVMPILIFSLLGGMAWFYIQSDPKKIAERKETIPLPRVAETSATHSLPGKDFELSVFKESHSPPPRTSKTKESEGSITTRSDATTLSSGLPPSAGEVTIRAQTANELIAASKDPRNQPLAADFTPWLSPLALDSYMRAKDQGHALGFWDRGHWMTSIEGRWKDGSHEFRIRYARTPEKPDWRWEYRINLVPDKFLETHAQMRKKGFSLVSSQSFLHPDQQRRYQAVWQFQPELGSSTTASGSRPEIAAANEFAGPPKSLRFSPAPAEQRPLERLFGESRPSNPGLATNPGSGTALDVNRLPFHR